MKMALELASFNFVCLFFPFQQNIGAWRVIFFVTIALFTIEFLVYTIFGSGEEQPWNKAAVKSNDPEKPAVSDESTPLNGTKTANGTTA